MGEIVLLDEHTINKIAAGEVVDRPASIVKELIENSIDAKAQNITVEIKNGGISYIKITDDGIGIASDDVEIAFERHATSKIRKEDDLRKITSMGFRGEALASIAAISKVTLISKKKDESVATKAIVEAGKVKSIEQVASTHGTVIQINDVFYNVPARYKFLKKDYTEAGYIEDVVIRTALVNPQVSFKYINNGKVILQTNGNGDIKTVIYSIFGKDIYQNILDLSYEYHNIKVNGVIGLPKIARSTRVEQYTYVNSRYIKDKILASAIDKGYSQQLEINKFAFAIINVVLNPENIDVNVHPAKLEVKFSNESEVFEAVYVAIKEALQKHNQIVSPFYSSNYQNPTVIKEILDKNKEFLEVQNKKSIDSTASDSEEITIEKENINNEIIEDNNISNLNSNDNITSTESNNIEIKSNDGDYISNELENNIKSSENLELAEENKSLYETEEEINIFDKNIASHPYKYVGSVFDTYIIIQIQDKMYIIDQHAAHERLLYEQIKENYYAKQKQTQMLLIPILMDVTEKEKDIVKENLEMFSNVGFIIEEFSDNQIKISGIPNLGFDIDTKSMFKDIIDELMGAYKTNVQNKEWRFLATVACKAAVKANMALSPKEHISLIDSMMKLDKPFTCPHGRPTAYEITKYEIERKFLRK